MEEGVKQVPPFSLWRVSNSPMSDLLVHLGLFGLGATAGFLNVLAGGGSVLVFAGMIFMGISPVVANATIRVGLVGQGLLALSSFRKNDISFFKEGLMLGLAAIPGAVAGAFLAVNIDQEVIKSCLVFVMCFVVVSILLPRNKVTEDDKEPDIGISPWTYPMFFLAGCYGGFIQAGVGFLIMSILAYFSKASLLRINVLKVVTVLVYNVPVIVVFSYYGLVNWLYGILLFAGYGLGGWFGASWSIGKDDKVIRWIIAGVIFLMVCRLILA